MTAYYNEVDPFAAAWLRELIRVGLIAPGEVDERSIEDVVPVELDGFTQCHFFAGVGVWSYALRHAGWPDDRQVWTGSCPCQPFSAAGKGAGFADERHLWPAFFHLISECKPVTIIGEQVANKDALAWLDLVFADLEGEGYTCGAVDTCAAGFGSPHIRQRLHWVANAQISGSGAGFRHSGQAEQRRDVVADCGAVGGMANANQYGRNQGRECVASIGDDGIVGDSAVGGLGNAIDAGLEEQRGNGRSSQKKDDGIAGETLVGAGSPVGRVADAASTSGPEHERKQGKGSRGLAEKDNAAIGRGTCGPFIVPGPTNAHWRDVDWLFCRDGKWRPVESLAVEMADGLADRLGYRRIGGRYSLDPLKEKAENRKMRLKGYGNAIVAEQAVEIIRAIMEEI